MWAILCLVQKYISEMIINQFFLPVFLTIKSKLLVEEITFFLVNWFSLYLNVTKIMRNDSKVIFTRVKY